ncbi:hypothetical protein OIU91_41360 (plasmid) [Streptomyces sp. NBC_01456]|nr:MULTISPECIES: hypothetical protein [unclassified Streptomyces]
MNRHLTIQPAPRTDVMTAYGDRRSLVEPGRTQDLGATGLSG